MFNEGTEFSQFIHHLYTVCADGNSQTQFTKETILASVLYSDNEVNPIEDKNPSTFNKYFTGENNVSRIAKEINAHFSKIDFSDYLLNFGGECLKSLYDHMCADYDELMYFEFDEEDPDINQKFVDVLATIFRDIFIRSLEKRKKEKIVEPTVITRNEYSYSESTEAKNQTLNMFQQFGNGNIQIASVKKIVLNDGGFEFEE